MQQRNGAPAYKVRRRAREQEVRAAAERQARLARLMSRAGSINGDWFFAALPEFSLEAAALTHILAELRTLNRVTARWDADGLPPEAKP